MAVVQKIAQPADKARDQAADLTGTNRQYVSDAKKFLQTAPDVLTAMKDGAVSMSEARTLLKPFRNEKKLG